MHDDRTRVMGQPEDPGGHSHGNMRLLVAGLLAVIVGLVIAIFVIAGGDGDGDTTSAPSEVTTLPTTDEMSTTETTDTTESTATETTTAPEEEGEDGGEEELEDESGGIEAP